MSPSGYQDPLVAALSGQERELWLKWADVFRDWKDCRAVTGHFGILRGFLLSVLPARLGGWSVLETSDDTVQPVKAKSKQKLALYTQERT